MHRIVAVISITASLLLMAAIPTSAAPVGSVSWVGHTSQATGSYPEAAEFIVKTHNGKSIVSVLYIEWISTCQQSGGVIYWGFGFEGVDLPIVNGDVRFVDSDIFMDHITWSGHIGDHSASGKLEAVVPGLVLNGGTPTAADLCPSGPQTWTAHPGPWSRESESTTADHVRISVIRHPDGTVTRSVGVIP